MRILVINPNSTASMTRSIEAAARLAARPGTEITAINPTDTPASIQGSADGLATLPGLFSLFESAVMAAGTYDACVIACFDDTGLMELRRRADIPVIGIGEAAFQMAMLLGERFSVVTTLSVSIPVIEDNLRAYGYAPRCIKVRASEVPVLALESDAEASADSIAKEIGRAMQEDRPDAIVLGCAGMAGLAERMSEAYRLPVIDGVSAAIALAEATLTTGNARWLKSGMALAPA